MSNTPDPISQGLLKVLTELEEQIDRQGWHQLPELFYIFRLSAGEAAEISTAPPGSLIVGFGIGSADVPARSWRKAYPPWKMLEALTETVHAYQGRTGTLPPIIPLELYGVAWACEAWDVMNRSPDEADSIGHAPRGTTSSYPDRNEIRFLHAIDAAGTYYAITRERGGSVTSDVYEHGRTPPERIPQGPAVDALNDLLAACLCYAPEPEFNEHDGG